jgi:hypothetical protein
MPKATKHPVFLVDVTDVVRKSRWAKKWAVEIAGWCEDALRSVFCDGGYVKMLRSASW